MIYRVHLYDDSNGSQGYSYHGSREAADATLAAWQAEDPELRTGAGIDAAETPHTKAEVLALLARWAGHNDNG